MESDVPGLASVMCALKHERAGTQKRGSEDAGLKEMRVVCVLKTHLCRLMAVDFWGTATVRSRKITASHLEALYRFWR